MTKRIGPHRSERIPAWASQALRKPVPWSSQLWKAYLEKKNVGKHQLIVNIMTTSSGLQMKVKIVRGGASFVVQYFHAQRDPRVHSLNLAALAVN